MVDESLINLLSTKTKLAENTSRYSKMCWMLKSTFFLLTKVHYMWIVKIIIAYPF